jgi:hypothetical protein
MTFQRCSSRHITHVAVALMSSQFIVASWVILALWSQVIVVSQAILALMRSQVIVAQQ